MLRLSVEITLGLNLLASVALDSPIEVVVLALRANPTTIWEVKLLL
jgi:hypothetical protein